MGGKQKFNRTFNVQHEPTSESDESNDDLNQSHDSTVKLVNRDLIFNYSNYNLSEAMKSLLGRALNFSVLPLKLDITEVLVDYNRFARAAIWQEYWHDTEKDENYKKPIFKTKKNNLP